LGSAGIFRGLRAGVETGGMMVADSVVVFMKESTRERL